MSSASPEHSSARRLAAARNARPASRALSASAALLAFALTADAKAAQASLSASFDPVVQVASGARSFASLSGAAWLGVGHALVAILGPLLAAIVAGVLIAGVAQWAASSLGQPGRGHAAPSAPFDLGARAQQLLEPARAIDGLSALLAGLVLLAIAWLTVAPSVPGLLALPGADPTRVAPPLLELLRTLALRLMLAGLCFGILDYGVRRMRFAQRLRITRRELLDEQREQYGDPAMRRERARQHGRLVARPDARSAPRGRER